MTAADVFGGRIDGQRHRLPVRVYYEDTDVGGIVFYANYLKYLERGRSEFLRALGVDQRALMAGGEPLLFVVRRCEIDYLRSARFDDLVEVVTGVAEVTGASLTMSQTVFRGDEVLVRAKILVAAVGGEGFPRRIPRPLRHIFNTLLCSDAPLGL